MGNFRPAKSHAKMPAKDAWQKLKDADIPWPRPPKTLDGNAVARAHFSALAASFSARVANHGFILANIEQCALIWSKQAAIIAALPSGDAARDKALLGAAKSLMAIYSQRLLESTRASRRDAVRLPPVEPARPTLASVHALDRGLDRLIARAKPPAEA